ncbi:delta-like protein A [Lates japonicus]|uniref:Delta-like protein A n=1 Tax=Lates japonicus TaxID=270547 RepID=A0AAD3N9A1_LATJO|nr:delta-like protein A [Lates japonicus]
MTTQRHLTGEGSRTCTPAAFELKYCVPVRVRRALLHGTAARVFCRSRDDAFGHFTCEREIVCDVKVKDSTALNVSD